MKLTALLRLLIPIVFLVILGETAGAQDWSLTGNTGTNPANNFLGTTDAQGFVLRTDNQERMRITETGNVNVGTNNSSSRLSILSNIPDGSLGMLHLRVTQPFMQRHRILTVAKRNSANTA